MKRRGIVIYPKIDVAQNTVTEPFYSYEREAQKAVHIEYTNMDPILLRMYTLYWDLIDWPKNNLIDLYPVGDIARDIAYLEQVGVLKRSNIRFNKESMDARLPYAVQVIALIRNSRKEDEHWTLGQSGFNLILPPDRSIIQPSVEIELYHALPVPHENVTIEDIIKFKGKRNDELQRFRHAMDGLYLQVVQSKDIPRAKSYTIDEIYKSVSELNRVMKEGKIQLVRPYLKVEVNVPDLLVLPTAGALAATQFNIPPEIGAALGLASALIKFKIGTAPSIKNIPSELRDYAYLASVEKNLKKRKGRKLSFRRKKK